MTFKVSDSSVERITYQFTECIVREEFRFYLERGWRNCRQGSVVFDEC